MRSFWVGGLLILWCIVGAVGVQAQTPTPTALAPGVYQFDTLTAPLLNLTGDWSITNIIDGTTYPDYFLTTSSGDATAQFSVTGASAVTIYQGVWDNTLDPFTVDVDGIEYTVSNSYPALGIQSLPLAISDTANITITRSGTGEIFLDYIAIQPQPFELPETTPEPYITLDEDGATRFEMVVTAGDVAITSILLFVLFSFWTVVFLFIVLMGKRSS